MVNLKNPILSECTVSEDPENPDNILLTFEPDKVLYKNGKLLKRVKIKLLEN